MSQQALQRIAENIRTKNPVLDLGNCGLTELYPELLAELAKTGEWLEELILSNYWWGFEAVERKNSQNKGEQNRLPRLPPTLPTFPLLRVLVASGLGISDCKPLATLLELNTLHIARNQISDCKPLAALLQLNTLYIHTNQISDCTPLARLTKLNTLDISRNQISDCTPLAELTTLNTMYISENQISDYSTLAALTALNTLYISSNRITDCTPLLPLIKKGIPIQLKWDNKPGLYLYNNPITNPPLEILQQGNRAVIQYFESIEKDRLAGKTPQQIRELKLIFLGEGESGKTTLMKRLLGLPVVKGEKQTQGITQMKWTVPDGEVDITVNMWDFGGQEIQHNAHQFFLTEDCIYVLVLDNRRDEQPEYWLQHILSLGKNSPILVVSNKVDIPAHATDRFNQELLKGKYNIHGFYKMSALHGTNIERFQTELLDLIKAFPFPQFSEDWIAVKDHIEAETALGKNLIMRQQLHNYCSQRVDEQDELVILKYLKTMGKVSFHAPNMHTRDFYILNPEWLIYAIYKIILSGKTVSQRGEIMLDDLEEILKPHETEPLFELRQKYVYEREQYPYLLEMMKEYHLCYTADGQRIIIPSAFPETHTLDFEASGQSLFFYLQYLDFLPPSIISQFIARMFPYKKDNRYWHSGMELWDAETSSHVLVQLDKDPKRIYITVNGEQRRAFFDLIRREFKKINDLFEKMRVEEQIPLPSKEKDQSVSYTELINHELDGKENYYHSKTRENFSVRELLAGIEPLSATMATVTTRQQLESKQDIERFNKEIDKLENLVASMAAPGSITATQQPTAPSDNKEAERLRLMIQDVAVKKWKRRALWWLIFSLLVTAGCIYAFFAEPAFIMQPADWGNFKNSDKLKIAIAVLVIIWNGFTVKMVYDRYFDKSKEKAFRDLHRIDK
jgi:internalin A